MLQKHFKVAAGNCAELNVDAVVEGSVQRQEAFALLNRAVDQRLLVVFFKTEPQLDPLHKDPRWPALLRRINLTREAALRSPLRKVALALLVR